MICVLGANFLGQRPLHRRPRLLEQFQARVFVAHVEVGNDRGNVGLWASQFRASRVFSAWWTSTPSRAAALIMSRFLLAVAMTAETARARRLSARLMTATASPEPA
jgi:hypothetical protein